MQIAYYSTGNVPDPTTCLHDRRGRPRLGPDEVVINRDHTAHARIVVRAGIVRRRELFPDVGPGSLYHTSERFIFLRDPPYREYVLRSSAGRVAEAGGISFDALQWQRKGWKEAFSLPMEEIKGYKRTRRGRKLYVVSGGNIFIVYIRSKIFFS